MRLNKATHYGLLAALEMARLENGEVVVLRVDLLMKLARFTERLQVDDVASLRVAKPADDALRDRSH